MAPIQTIVQKEIVHIMEKKETVKSEIVAEESEKEPEAVV